MKKLLLILFLTSQAFGQFEPFDFFNPPYQKETIAHIKRVVADGGVVYDKDGLDRAISAMKFDKSYNSAKILCDPNWGVKVDGSGYVSKLYNVMGATGDLTQSTAANQPKLIVYKDNSGANTQRRILLFDGSNDYLKTASMTLNQPEVVYMGLRQVSWTLNDFIFDGYTLNSGRVGQATTTPLLRMNAGSVSAENGNLSLGPMGLMKCVFNGTSGIFQINNTTALTGDYGSANMGGFTLGSAGNNGSSANIESGTILILNAVPTATQDQRIKDRLMARWKL